MDWSILGIYVYDEDKMKYFNILSVAYIGDCVYEMYFRNYIVKRFGHIDSNKLHLEVIKYVNAKFQTNIYYKIKDIFKENEIYYFKRGRNSRIKTIPKNCGIGNYKIATGLESVIGYLYMIGNFKRLDFIFNEIFKLI
jgi:Uncharacterized protein conserved in bacteria